MPIVTSESRNVEIAPPILMKRFSVPEYHQMIHAGVFALDNRFELLEGWIVPKMSRNPPHDASMDLTRDALEQRLFEGWRVRQQSAVTIDDSEPEPDLAVVEGDARRYSARHPGPSDIRLIVEIADSSLMDDRRRKMRLYARAAIREFWIVNLITSQVEVYSDPTGPSGAPAFRSQHIYKVGETVPMSLDGRELSPIPVADLLP